ncbi:MAG: rRNA pseudouridine synthase [Caldilineales bacterium]|nr:rRNA pseudouridine synthase [Caldilineales bacterium]MDW8318481.1 pseudouridine synthase [Anaerolineae bacterium]
MALERLQKVMARAGVASRRACEEMIAAGRVQVNGRVVTELGTKVDPQRDRIAVDGVPIAVPSEPKRVYLMLYKPAGYLSVFNDERGRPGLEQLVSSEERLFTVGRLDLDSEGLMLLTNDGELTQVLTHPGYQHPKVYLVLVDRPPSTDALAQLRRGVVLDGQKTAPSSWRVLDEPPKVPPLPQGGSAAQGVWLKVVLREGRKRQIRRMAAAVGLEVRRLIRIQLGPLVLDRRLKPGGSRRLTADEVRRLRRSAEASQPPAPPRRRGRRQPATPVGHQPSRPDAEPRRSVATSEAARSPRAQRSGSPSSQPDRAQPLGQRRQPPSQPPPTARSRPPHPKPTADSQRKSPKPPSRPRPKSSERPADRPNRKGR